MKFPRTSSVLDKETRIVSLRRHHYGEQGHPRIASITTSELLTCLLYRTKLIFDHLRGKNPKYVLRLKSTEHTDIGVEKQDDNPPFCTGPQRLHLE